MQVGAGFGVSRSYPSRRSRVIGGSRGMMIGRAVETGLPGRDERVRDAAPAADERPRERYRDPGPAPSDRGSGAAAERAAGPVPRHRPGDFGGAAVRPAPGSAAPDAAA